MPIATRVFRWIFYQMIEFFYLFSFYISLILILNDWLYSIWGKCRIAGKMLAKCLADNHEVILSCAMCRRIVFIAYNPPRDFTILRNSDSQLLPDALLGIALLSKEFSITFPFAIQTSRAWNGSQSICRVLKKNVNTCMENLYIFVYIFSFLCSWLR